MTRLPCCDRTTVRSELAVFASLGLAGVMMVALALFQVTWEVTGGSHQDAARAGWTKSSAVPTTAGAVQPAATNSSFGAAVGAHPAPPDRGVGRLRPAGQPGVQLNVRLH